MMNHAKPYVEKILYSDGNGIRPIRRDLFLEFL